MANLAFTALPDAQLITQPNPAGEKLIIRSTSASDTTNATVSGLAASVSTAAINALLGKREVQTTATFTSLTQLKLAAAQVGVVSVYGQGTKAQGDIRVDALPANNDVFKAGLTGFEQTYTFKTTLSGAANEIKIAASVGAQATNIYEAINAGSGAGTDYGTGTAANAYVAASTPVGAVVVLTDKIAVARQLTWNVSQTVGATLSIRPMIGGATGILLAMASVGQVAIYNRFIFSSEDLSTLTLPALLILTTQAIALGGSACVLRFKCANVATPIQLKYQTSTDSVNWSEPLVTGISIDNNSVADPLYVIPNEWAIEYIRLVILTNANTSDTALDARVIY